ncbi:hypothetical protein BpHYR1_002664 [Brachionus plicatilis]|uniref:Uncharacterized protein n=1 Tax=Brachionus plicatilis TaxID=10195 RepID=A0A3M7RM49_BRAPC|nr:hypothetical protein BpHYR1_002664 [Brachionus plicatilis]
MKYDLDSVVPIVEQLTFSERAQNRIHRIIDHIVSANGRQSMSLNRRVHTLFELDYVLVAKYGVTVRQVAFQTSLVNPLAKLILQIVHSLSQLLADRLAFQRLDIEAGRVGRKDQKSNHGHVRIGRFQLVIQSGQ